MIRFRTWLAAAVLLTASPAAAGPLDPPEADRWRIWEVARVDATPRVLDVTTTVTASTNRAMVFSVMFERGAGGVRDFVDAQFTGLWVHPMGGAYPRVTAEGHGEPVPCPAQLLCTEPDGPEYPIRMTAGYVPTTMSMYVIGINVEVVGIDVDPGWTLTELPASSVDVHLVRTGTGVDTRAAAGVNVFRYASRQAVRGPSIAFAAIPCPWSPVGGFMGPGQAELDGAGPPTSWGTGDRRPDCDYLEIGRAANDAPTTWTLHGEAAGLMPWQFHLIVVELPPA